MPLVFAGPGVTAGATTHRPAELLDIYPTLVELAGLPEKDGLEGISLVPLLDDPGKAWPHPSVIGWKKNSFAVQNEQFRYIRYGDGSEELYDHDRDPRLLHDQSGPRQPDA